MEIFYCIGIVLLIIFEICLTWFLVKKIILTKDSILKLNTKIQDYGIYAIVASQKIKSTVFKASKVVSIFTNKKLYKTYQIIKTAISVIELILLIKTLNFKKLKKPTFKNISKLLFIQISKKYLFRIIKFIAT